MNRIFQLLSPLLFALAASAQSPSPDVRDQGRPIRALSPERQAGLLAGAGLGYAKAAELNGHPGPKHVLELADELALSPEQRTGVQASFDRMRAAAVALGADLVAAEAELDRRFSHRHLDPGELAKLTRRIGGLEGQLRYEHLAAHLETDALLTPEQRARYAELRGYGRGPDAAPHEHEERGGRER